MSTRIYVMTHTAFDPPQDPAYIPLHVGRAGKADLGYLGDDTGEHISDLNCYTPVISFNIFCSAFSNVKSCLIRSCPHRAICLLLASSLQ